MKDFIEGAGCLVALLYSAFMLLSIVFKLSEKERPVFYMAIVLCLFIVAFVIIYFNRKSKYEEKERKFVQETHRIKSEFQGKERKLKEEIELRERQCSEKESKVKRILDANSPFTLSASLKTDMDMYVFDDAIKYLRHKQRPAFKKADEIEKGLRVKYRKCELRYKEMLYKYEFLLNAFPDVKNYIDKEEELITMAKDWSYANCEESRDRVSDFLNTQEWKKLSPTQRNQLALDRYVQGRKKSAWAVGRDYEMSCAHVLKNKGYEVEMHGIENGKNDLGRDLIAADFEKDLFGMNCLKVEIYIIQCKYWRKENPIRENVIMQLYGSTIAYMAKYENSLGKDIEVKPILMIPSFSILSDTALQFTRLLNINIWRSDLVDFPRIKCNINGTDKIYHLPFDQQYDRAQIKNKGEFYAYTVAEAEEAGFRRAMRHVIDN